MKKGFTLIELLVVIAIIGILASVVLASLSSARNKGKDAAVSSELSNMRAQAELFYTDNDGYGTFSTTTNCATGSLFVIGTANSLSTLIAGVVAEGTTPLCNATAASGTIATSWAVSAALPSDAASFFCVDSSGYSNKGTKQSGVTSGVASCQ